MKIALSFPFFSKFASDGHDSPRFIPAHFEICFWRVRFSSFRSRSLQNLLLAGSITCVLHPSSSIYSSTWHDSIFLRFVRTRNDPQSCSFYNIVGSTRQASSILNFSPARFRTSSLGLANSINLGKWIFVYL